MKRIIINSLAMFAVGYLLLTTQTTKVKASASSDDEDSAGDSHWIFNWAKEGDWVYVHDPSGATPTDPAKYGQGGA
jgi:hypothetical protein